MIGVFLKELRENLKWATVIFGVMILTVGSLMRQHNPQLLFQLSEPPVLFFVPLAGLLMGVVQSLFETRADNWSFVVHRPVTRKRIFFAKSAAGLLLLIAALELPFLLTAAWAARPGNLRMPFQARMLLPGLAVAINSACYYFAGVVLTLRKARWFGTRLLPIGLALCCSVAVLLAPEFWQAMVFVLAGAAISAVAAWGVFATAGAVDGGTLPRLSLGTMIYAGTLAAAAAVVGFLGIFQSTTGWSWWRMDREGNVIHVVTTIHDNQRTFKVTSLSGERLPEFDGVDLDDPAHANSFLKFPNTLLDDNLIPWPARSQYWRGSYLTPLPGVISLRAVAKPGRRVPATCLFDVQRRIIDLYDSTSRTLIGTVGPAGFSPGRTPPREFFPGQPLNPSSQQNRHALAFESTVYWMELDHRRVRKFFDAPANDPIISIAELTPDTDPTVFIATRHRLLVMDPSGKLLFPQIDADISSHFYVPATLKSKQHLIVWSGPMTENVQHPVISEYLPDGKLLRRIEPQPYSFTVTRGLPRIAVAGFFYPLAGLPLYRPGLLGFLLQVPPQILWHFQLWLFVAGLLCALVTIVLGRKYGLSRTPMIGWTIAGALLGPGGVIAFLGLYELPVREECPVCGGMRLAGRDECSQCAAALPPPTFDGREIFEPGGMAGALAV